MIKSISSKSLSLSSRMAMSTAVKHTPPIKLFGVNGRYATALYISASKSGLLNKVDEELTAFTDVIKKSPNFASFLANPTVPRSEKTMKISSLLGEGKISDPTRNLMVTLAANGKLSEIHHIIRSFDDLIQASRGVVRVTVITAEALKKKQVEALETAVMGYVGKDKKIDMTVQLKEEILGGLQVMIGDKFIDLSVNSRVSELSKYLETADL